MKIDISNCHEYSIRFNSAVAIYNIAATELNEYVKKVCGLSLSVNKQAKHYICIGGDGEGAQIKKDFDDSSLKQDGFRIVFMQGNIHIYGNTAQATYYGVCAFIERFLGVRWLNTDTTYIPQKESIEIEEKEIVEIPYFNQRLFYAAQALALHPENTAEASAAIAAHQRFNAPLTPLLNFFGRSSVWHHKIPEPHNSTYFVEPSTYEREHPEFFFKSPMGATELCYSNGITDDYQIEENMETSVVKATAKTLYEFIKEDPSVEYYSFGRRDDETALCPCAVCQKRRKALGGEAGIMMVFFNAVVQETERLLYEEGIDSNFKIVTLAYQNTEDPPLKDGRPIHKAVIPSERIHIRYAPISADYTYSLVDVRQKEAIRNRLLGWAKLTSNIMIWDYQTNYVEYCWYFPNLSYFKENLKAYADIGVSYVFNQAAYNINRHWQDEMRSYIASKLYWDLSLDIETLRDEYITLCYGVASEEVRTFVCKMESFFAKKIEQGFHVALFLDDKEFFAAKEYPVEFLEECISILEKGIEKIRTSDYESCEKEKREKALFRILLTPLRMLAKNAKFYYPDKQTDYEKRVFSIAKFVGLDKFGEGVSLFVDIVKDGICKHKIVLGQKYTENEYKAAVKLQERLREMSGLTLEIVQDDKVYPSYMEHALCVGDGMMVREFYKGTVNVNDYEYYVDVRGRCAFIFGKDSLFKGVDVFIEQLLIDGKDISLPAVQKEKKWEK